MIRRESTEQKVAWFHGDSDEVCGSPRILADLRADGETISRKTVAKTMQRLGLVGICPKKWRTTTIIDHSYPVDAVKRKWDTGTLNQVWVGDISYVRTWEGWVYLATVIDAHSRRVIGWAIAAHMRTDLIENALMMAMTLRGDRPAQVIFHSGRGTQGRFDRWKQHLGRNHRVRAQEWHHPLDGVYRYLLGRRDGRELLRDAENRVLLPPCGAHPRPRHPRSRGLDRRAIQPTAPALLDRRCHPRRREAVCGGE